MLACIHYSFYLFVLRSKVTLQCFPSLIFSDMNIQLHDYKKRVARLDICYFHFHYPIEKFFQDFPSLLLIFFFLNIEYIFIILALT